MANTFSPFGFRTFGDQDGAAPTMGLTRFNLASSDTNNYFTGDVVALSTTILGNFIAPPSSGTTLGNPILGIFVGCEFFSPTVGRNVFSPNFAASVGSSNNGSAYVITDPNQLFTVQGTTTAVLGTSAIGLTVGFASSLQATGNTLSGISNVALNSSTAGTNATAPFRIVDVSCNYAPPGTNGTDSASAGAILVVQFNNQYRRTVTALST